MLGRVEDADGLKLGCGGGQCTVELASRGATVTGVDLSAAFEEAFRVLQPGDR